MHTSYLPLRRTSDDEGVDYAGSDEPSLKQQLLVVRKAKRVAKIFTLLAFVALGANFYILLRGRQTCASLQKGLYPDLLPQVPEETVIFEQHKVYASPSSEESDKAWDDLLPPGRGYVFVDDGEEYGLQPGETTEFGQIYSVAVFHQLHCLGMIRNNYWKLLDKTASHDADLNAFTTMHQHNGHTNHCFDYLRQALQCAGDMALEWPRTEVDGQRKNVDGWNIPHQCKSWSTIMEFMENKHFNASKRVDISGD